MLFPSEGRNILIHVAAEEREIETRRKRGIQEGQEDGETAMGGDEKPEKHRETLARWGDSDGERREARKTYRTLARWGELIGETMREKGSYRKVKKVGERN